MASVSELKNTKLEEIKLSPAEQRFHDLQVYKEEIPLFETFINLFKMMPRKCIKYALHGFNACDLLDEIKNQGITVASVYFNGALKREAVFTPSAMKRMLAVADEARGHV